MPRRNTLILVAAFIGLLAVLYPRNTERLEEPKKYPGRNNTVLFLSNGDSALGNALLATTYSLLIDHTDLEVHYGTFKKFEKPIQNINKWAASKSSSAGTAQFHKFKGLDYIETLDGKNVTFANVTGPPGLPGFGIFRGNFHNYLMPWNGPAYLSLYNEAVALIEEIDPAVVVADVLFSPGVDAVRALGRREAIISPNGVKDNFVDHQPWLAVLWRYPFMSTGYRFPLPWYQIPQNIYMAVRVGYTVFNDPILVGKRAWLKANGIKNPLNFAMVWNKDITFLSGGSLDSEFPLSVIPTNAIICGPIYLSSAPASQQDPELAKWLKRAPTVLINLGSRTTFSEGASKEMIAALRKVFDTTSVQVLWKYNKRGAFSDDFLFDVSKEITNGRLRLEKWLTADPAALLETGDIVLFVHHGGANCYHEGVGTGVPHLILPMWADCYDYATRAEYLGIGVWGNEKAAPDWTSDELGVAFSKVLGNGTQAVSIREKAAALGKERQKNPGRIVAAREVAKLARLGGV